MDTKEVEAPTEPPTHCMSTSCGREAVSALRINFVYACKGFPPKRVTAWFGLYVCTKCGTQANATAFAQAQNKDFLALGAQIGSALGAQSFDIKSVVFDKRAGADKDFYKYTEMKAAHDKAVEAEIAARRSSIVDAAKDSIQ